MGPLVLFALMLPFFSMPADGIGLFGGVGGWIGVLTGFYAFYQPAGETWSYAHWAVLRVFGSG